MPFILRGWGGDRQFMSGLKFPPGRRHDRGRYCRHHRAALLRRSAYNTPLSESQKYRPMSSETRHYKSLSKPETQMQKSMSRGKPKADFVLGGSSWQCSGAFASLIGCLRLPRLASPECAFASNAKTRCQHCQDISDAPQFVFIISTPKQNISSS